MHFEPAFARAAAAFGYTQPQQQGPTRSEQIACNREEIRAAEERYLAFAMGIPGQYSLIKSLANDDRKIDQRSFQVKEGDDGTRVSYGTLSFPFEWLFRETSPCDALTDNVAEAGKEMHSFIRHVLEAELEYAFAFRDFIAGRRARKASAEIEEKKAEEPKPPLFNLATKDGVRVEQTTEAVSIEKQNDTPMELDVAPLGIDFVVGESFGFYSMTDGAHDMQIQQGRWDNKMRIKVETIDPKHTLAQAGVTIGLMISTQLITRDGALRALQGNAHQKGAKEKIALVEFIRKKLTERDTSRKTA